MCSALPVNCIEPGLTLARAPGVARYHGNDNSSTLGTRETICCIYLVAGRTRKGSRGHSRTTWVAATVQRAVTVSQSLAQSVGSVVHR